MFHPFDALGNNRIRGRSDDVIAAFSAEQLDEGVNERKAVYDR